MHRQIIAQIDFLRYVSVGQCPATRWSQPGDLKHRPLGRAAPSGASAGMEGAERDSKAARLLGAESLSTSASSVRHNRSPCANRRPIATKALKMLGATMDDIMVDKALRVIIARRSSLSPSI